MRKISKESLIERLEIRYPNNEFEYISGFKNMSTQCTFKCNNCGNEKYTISPTSILDKRKKNIACNECNHNSSKKGETNFKNNLPEDFEIIGRYINNKELVKVKHSCGYIFDFKPNNLTLDIKERCPKCNLSPSEKYVSEYLDNLDIKYEVQKTFDSCKNDRVTPFDFYIPDMNLLLEIDGKQHYGISWNDDKEFERIQLTDQIKMKWAKDNKIGLLKFPAVNYGEGEVKVFLLDDFFLDHYFSRDLIVVNKQYITSASTLF